MCLHGGLQRGQVFLDSLQGWSRCGRVVDAKGEERHRVIVEPAGLGEVPQGVDESQG